MKMNTIVEKKEDDANEIGKNAYINFIIKIDRVSGTYSRFASKTMFNIFFDAIETYCSCIVSHMSCVLYHDFCRV